MFLVLGKTLYNRINEFIEIHCTFIQEVRDFIKGANVYFRKQREMERQMSELANQLLASVNNLAQAQSAVSTSLGDYFAKVTVLLEKIKDSDDDEIQQAITGINAAAAAVNSDGANLQAHSQALADATGTAAPTQPVPTAPSTDNPAPTEGSTPPVEGGETPSNPSGGDPTAPANDNNGADGTTISEGSQGAEDDSNAPDGSEASEGAPGSEQPAAESNNA